MEILTLGNFEEHSNKRRKRSRLSKSCNNCRSRKIKCDQRRPRCSSCYYRKLDNCAYENDYNLSLEDLKKDNELLRRRLFDLESQESPEHSISRSINSETVTIKPKRVTYFGLTSFRSLVNDSSYPQSLRIYNEKLKEARKSWKHKHKVDDNFLGLKQRLGIEQLTDILPGYDEFYVQMNYFFDSIWFDYFPIVNKGMVNQDFHRIAISKQGRLGFKPSDCQDYSKISLILIVFKFSLLTKENLDFNSCRILSLQDIFLNLIDGVQEDNAFLKRASLATLQALLLQRIFKRFNFFDGDGGDCANGSLMFSLSYHMGITLGLHRNIDELYSSKSVEYRSLLKEIRKCLLYLDVQNSIDLGVPLHFEKDLSQKFLDITKRRSRITLLLQRCAYILTKSDVFADDLLNVIGMIKSFLDKNHIKPIFEYFRKLNDGHSRDAILEILEIIPIFSLVQHLRHLLSNYYEELNEELYVYNRNITLKYGFLVILSITTLISSLGEKNLLNIGAHENFLLVVGVMQPYFIKAYISLMVFMFKLSESNRYKHFRDVLIHVAMINDFKDDDNNLYKAGDFPNADPAVINEVMKEAFSKLFPAQNQKCNRFYSLFLILSNFKIFSSFLFGERNSLKTTQMNIKIDYDGYVPKLHDSKSEDILDAFFALNSHQWTRSSDLDFYDYNYDDFFEKYFEEIEKFNDIFLGFTGQEQDNFTI